ncbi:MAG: amidophosphoribosyltransferase [Alphaproteobacteria bacterium GM202ARS2]|nr:amidophosphoribosyltransferase [Alphaproteobacteria bacterium GM202ARS2]
MGDDTLREECGVFGVMGHKEASALTALGLHALQHRGQEASGIVSCEQHNGFFYSHRATGHVGDIFSKHDVIRRLKGTMAVGHNRYSTTGASGLHNVQPLFSELSFGGLALAHNGNLTNALSLRRELVSKGSLFQSTSDTEVIVHLIAASEAKALEDKIVDALTRVVGAYSLVLMTSDTLVGVRDPYGVRPLALGRLDEAWLLASESCAFDIIGGTHVRDVMPGEMVVVDKAGKMRSFYPFSRVAPRFCLFEYIYFSRPDSFVEGRSVYDMRKKIGEQLAFEDGDDVGDIVVPVPDSGLASAIGYAQASSLPFEMGIVRNHYVGRTFIEPMERIRHFGVRLKHNAHRAALADKRVILIDDSLVRGTTSRKIVGMVRGAGAKEVHLRVSSPPVRHSCFYGIDTPDEKDLLATQNKEKDIAKIIGADSVRFISLEGLYRALHKPNGEHKQGGQGEKHGFCDACFSGVYPIACPDRDKLKKGEPPLLSAMSHVENVE